MTQQWTRDDLPYGDEFANPSTVKSMYVEQVLDAVVKYLNTHHPKPRPIGEDEFLDLYIDVIAETSGLGGKVWWLHRTWAKKIVERLNAHGGVPAKRRYGDVVVGGAPASHELATALRDRDEAMDAESAAMLRAKSAEAERDEAVVRAEAAEARTAVTREDVDEAVRGIVPVWDSEVEKIIAALHSLVSGDDPAVFVVRESDVAAVKVERNEGGRWCAEGDFWPDVADVDVGALRRNASVSLADVAAYEAVARAIEAEQVDPVEELAGQIETATRAAIRQACVDLADVAPSIDPLTVEQAMEVTAASRKVAAHVLGQEADQ